MKNWILKLIFEKRDAAIQHLNEELKRALDAKTDANKRWSACCDRMVELRKERDQVFRRPAEEMTDEELQAAFDVDEDNGLWMAVHQVLDRSILEVVDAISWAPTAATSEQQRTHYAGGLDQLRSLQTDLLRRRQRARSEKKEPVESDVS